MGQASSVWIEQAVAVDDLVLGVGEEWKVDLAAELFSDSLDGLERVFGAVGADRDDLSFGAGLFIQQLRQLAELGDAKRSPVPAVKHQHNLLVSAKLRQGHHPPGFIGQTEVGRLRTHRHPIQVGGRKARLQRCGQEKH